MCFVEVIDTAGQGWFIYPLHSTPWNSPHPQRSMQHCGINGSGKQLSPPDTTPLAQDTTLHREGQGFILVYSIASRATFERLEVFRQAMLKVKRQAPIFMLVGNKCDKQYEREVTREEGIQLARTFGCEFLETSAKTAHNVERLFTTLVRLLRQSKEQDGSPGPVHPPEEKKKDRIRRCIIM
ncbi:hypothetical protein QCA50_001574 [Cerrena zonata]|uniref:Uncharacterized protein n=1 Tax=Cerrena zonata TaxID=2478898 RepID=A0AAW0GM27_9APHY